MTVPRVTRDRPSSRLAAFTSQGLTVSAATSSMARTTGYTCTAAANLILEGKYARKGISPPEYLGEEEENFKFIMGYLQSRGVRYVVSESDR